jgi:hypothetical protein
LQTELAKVEASAAGHRADFERERERADRLMAELLRATADRHGSQGSNGQLPFDRVFIGCMAERWMGAFLLGLLRRGIIS